MIKFATQTLMAHRFRMFCFSGTSLARKIHPRQILCQKTLEKKMTRKIPSQKTSATNAVRIFAPKIPLERICRAKFLLTKCREGILCACPPIFFYLEKFCEQNSFPQNAMNKFVTQDLPQKNAGNPQNKKLLQKSIARRWDGHKKGAMRAECDPRFAPVK